MGSSFFGQKLTFSESQKENFWDGVVSSVDMLFDNLGATYAKFWRLFTQTSGLAGMRFAKVQSQCQQRSSDTGRARKKGGDGSRRMSFLKGSSFGFQLAENPKAVPC